MLGCSDIDPADGTWVSRSPGNDEVITVGCHGGNKEWQLRCIDNEWVGPGGQCGPGMLTFHYTIRIATHLHLYVCISVVNVRPVVTSEVKETAPVSTNAQFSNSKRVQWSN